MRSLSRIIAHCFHAGACGKERRFHERRLIRSCKWYAIASIGRPAELCIVIFNSINVARHRRLSRVVCRERSLRRIWIRTCQMPRSVRGGLAEALSRRAIDPFVRLAWDPAAINKGRRDEQSGTTVAMSHGMYRLLSNGCRDEDNDDDDDESLNAPNGTRADPSLDCIKAFPKWAIPKPGTFSSSLPVRSLFSHAVFILPSRWTVLHSITNDSQMRTTETPTPLSWLSRFDWSENSDRKIATFVKHSSSN